MSVINPRNRLVNFRVSEKEFDLLKEASSRHGARSLSEFARNAVLGSLELDGAGRLAGGGVEHIDNRVSRLEIHVEQLLRLLAATGVAGTIEAGSAALVRNSVTG